MNPFSLGDAQLSCRVPLDSQLLLGATLLWFQLLLGAPVPQPQFPVPHLLPSEDCLHLFILFVPVASPCVFHSWQTCMGKDVTLHVSASNPAMLLYQKFGFKTEEYVLDFYDKYYPLESTECKHAFFLRLRR